MYAELVSTRRGWYPAVFAIPIPEWTAQATDQCSVWEMSIDVSFNLVDDLR